MGLGRHSGFYHEGDHAAICDICGFRYRRSQLRYNWKRQLVCDRDWEERNPQEYAVHPRGDAQGVADPRPRPAVVYIQQSWELRASGDLPTITGDGVLG